MNQEQIKDPAQLCDACGVEGCGSGHHSGARRIHQKIPQVSSRIGKIIGILSGKGGVGKSFVTSSLAVSLARQGKKVGIMDADITGPSIPRLFHIVDFAQGDEKGMYPVLSAQYQIKIMSVNLMLDQEDVPVLWRGPIVGGVVDQFFTETYWEDLDYLLIDMPPGTSDVALSVLQDIPLHGLIMVTTPSKLVSSVVSKAIVMAQKMQVPVIGIVNNMAYIKGQHGAPDSAFYPEDDSVHLAEKYHLPLLATVPLDVDISYLADEGRIEDYNKDYLDPALQAMEAFRHDI